MNDIEDSNLQTLLNQLRSGEKAERINAATRLKEMGLIAIPSLLEILKDNEVSVRLSAISILRKIGFKPVTVVSALQERLEDPDNTVRFQAIWALIELKAWDKKTFDTIKNILNDPAPHMREFGANALAALGPAGRKAVPDLIRRLKDDDAWVRRRSAAALGAIGHDAKESLEALSVAKGSTMPKTGKIDPDLRNLAEKAILDILPESAHELVEYLQHENNIISMAAVRKLGNLGQKARETVPALKKLLDTYQMENKELVEWAIKKIMTKTLWNVWFTGKVKEGYTVEEVKKNLCPFYGEGNGFIKYLFSGQRVLVQEKTSFEHAMKIKKVFKNAGADCGLEPVEMVDRDIDKYS